MSDTVHILCLAVDFVAFVAKVTYGTDGGCYELLTFSSVDGGASGGPDPNDMRRGPCIAVVFLARNRFAVLDKSRQVGAE